MRDFTLTDLRASEEAALIERAQVGDDRARDEILRRSEREAKRIVNTFGVPAHRSFEAYQEALIGINEAIDKFDPIAGKRFGPLGRAYARFALRQLFRAPRRAIVVVPMADDNVVWDGMTYVSLESLDDIYWGDGWLADAVAGLPPLDRQLVEMEYGAGYTRAEVARLRDVTRSAVTQKMKKVLGSLAEHAPTNGAWAA